jgi:hypothetical protein
MSQNLRKSCKFFCVALKSEPANGNYINPSEMEKIKKGRCRTPARARYFIAPRAGLEPATP